MKYLAVVLMAVALLVTPAFASDAGSDPVSVTVIEASDSTVVSDLDVFGGSRGSFLDALEGIFGEYQPNTYSVTTYLSDGSSVTTTEVVPGIAGLDWMWIAGVGLFALFLLCLMKLLGGVVK